VRTCGGPEKFRTENPADSFTGVGDRAFVISDEAHHVIAAGKAKPEFTDR